MGVFAELAAHLAIAWMQNNEGDASMIVPEHTGWGTWLQMVGGDGATFLQSMWECKPAHFPSTNNKLSHLSRAALLDMWSTSGHIPTMAADETNTQQILQVSPKIHWLPL